MLGAIWGLGHTTSLFIAGLLVLLLAVNINETVSSRMEFGVGIMLAISRCYYVHWLEHWQVLQRPATSKVITQAHPPTLSGQCHPFAWTCS